MLLPPASRSEAKALKTFVSNVKQAPTLEAEQQLVEAELITIRKALLDAAGLTVGAKCKILLELVFINTLGYDIGTTGAFEALNLLTASAVSARCLAYFVLANLFPSDTDVITFIGQRLHASLGQPNQTDHELSAALHAAASMSNKEIIQVIFPHIQRIANPAHSTPPALRKKAHLCLLRAQRRCPELVTGKVWAPRLAQALQMEKDNGCLVSLSSLIAGALQTTVSADEWSAVFCYALKKLEEIRSERAEIEGGIYHGVESPWLQVKLLLILQFFPCPTAPQIVTRLEQLILNMLDLYPQLMREADEGSANKNSGGVDQGRMNASWMILYEVVKTVLHFQRCLAQKTLAQSVTVVAGLANQQTSHHRYAGVEMMCRIAEIPQPKAQISKRLNDVMSHMSNLDPAMRRQTAELLFILGDGNNWRVISQLFIKSLKEEEDQILIEELPLKTAILIEKFAPTPEQYIEGIIDLLQVGTVPREIWHRVVQILVGFSDSGTAQNVDESRLEELQTFGARTSFNKLLQVQKQKIWLPDSCLVRLCCYVLGEYGHLLVADRVPPQRNYHQMLTLLGTVFQMARPNDTETRGIVLVAMAKVYNGSLEEEPQVAKRILDIYRKLEGDSNFEIQQRAAEFLRLCQKSPDFLESILSLMPPYPSQYSTQSSVLRRLSRLPHRNREAMATLKTDESPMLEDLRPSHEPGIQSSQPALVSSTDSETITSTTESDTDEDEDEEDRASSSSTLESSEIQEKRDSRRTDGGRGSERGQKSRKRKPVEGPDRFLPPVALRDERATWQRSCLVDKVVIVDTPVIRVTCRRRLTSQQAVLQLAVENISARPIRIAAGPIAASGAWGSHEPQGPLGGPHTVDPKQSRTHIVQIVHQAVAAQAPPQWTLQVADATGQLRRAISVAVPLASHSFCTPATAATEMTLKAQWTAHMRPDCVVVGQLAPWISTEAILKGFMETGLRMKVIEVGQNLFGVTFCATATQGQPWIALRITSELKSGGRGVKFQTAAAIPQVAMVMLRLYTAYLIARQMPGNPLPAARVTEATAAVGVAQTHLTRT